MFFLGSGFACRLSDKDVLEWIQTTKGLTLCFLSLFHFLLVTFGTVVRPDTAASTGPYESLIYRENQRVSTRREYQL